MSWARKVRSALEVADLRAMQTSAAELEIARAEARVLEATRARDRGAAGLARSEDGWLAAQSEPRLGLSQSWSSAMVRQSAELADLEAALEAAQGERTARAETWMLRSAEFEAAQALARKVARRLRARQEGRWLDEAADRATRGHP